MYKSTLKRVDRCVEILKTHYEPGRQDRSKQWVWRYHIYPEMGISRATFFNYLKISNTLPNRPLQLSLFPQYL